MTGPVAAADAAPTPDATEPTGRWWRWGAGLVVLAYVVAHVVEITLVRVDGRAYLQLRDWWASPPGRVATSVVVVAVLVHGANGLAQAWAGWIGEPARARDPRTLAVVWFVVVALAIPAVALAVWPWLQTTF